MTLLQPDATPCPDWPEVDTDRDVEERTVRVAARRPRRTRTAAIAALLLLGALVGPACAARAIAAQAPLEPTPSLYLNHRLPAETRICVPVERFRNEGVACITVGDLRALLRLRRDISGSSTGVPTKVVA